MISNTRSDRVPLLIELAAATFLALAAVDTNRLQTTWPVDGLRAVALLVLLVALVRQFARHEPTIVSARLSPPVTLLWCWVLWALTSALGPGWLQSIALTSEFAVLLASTQSIQRTGGSRSLARVLALGLGLYLAISLVLIKVAELPTTFDGRLVLASLEANQLARVAVIGGLGGLWLARETTGLQRIAGLAAAGLGGSALLATASRTSAVGLVVVLAVLAVHASRRRLAALALSLALLFIALPLSGVSGLVDTRPVAGLVARGNSDVQELGGRSHLWPLVLEEIGNSPIVGIGLGDDRELVANLPVGWDAQHAHNFVLHLLLTTGFVGTVLLIAGIIFAFRESVLLVNPLSLSLLTFVLINGISEPVVRVPSFGWFAICAGVCLSGTPAQGVLSSISRSTESSNDIPLQLQDSDG